MKNIAETKRKPAAIAEIIFDVFYLVAVVMCGISFLANAKDDNTLRLYGVMALVLGGGDAFHLVPRIYAQWTNTMETHTAALGFGKFVTSVTMTVFYVLLYFVWQGVYAAKSTAVLTGIVILLAAVRILLCFFPQNKWLSKNAPLSWALWRNLPFIALGAVVAVLFAASAAHTNDAFAWMWLALLLSYLFYIPVVFFSQKYPPVGMLMLPKTCAYLWIVCMGLQLLP